MFEGISTFFKKVFKPGHETDETSKDTAKERLHLVLMQDRANVSADFLDLMKQEIIEVIKKYIDVDEKEIDVRLTNQPNDDGTTGAPALYANIPIINIKNDVKGEKIREKQEEEKAKIKEKEEEKENKKEEDKKEEKEDNENEESSEVEEKKKDKEEDKKEENEKSENNGEEQEESDNKTEEESVE